MAQKTEIEAALVGSNQNHALAKTNASIWGNFGSDTKVGSFTAVEKVSMTWRYTGNSFRISFF